MSSRESQEIALDQIKSPDLASPGFKANPFPFYAWLRLEAPVYRTTLAFWRSAWLVTRYDDVLTVLKDERFANDWFAMLPWAPRLVRRLGRNMLTVNDPDHARLRALVNKAFTPRRVEGMQERIQAVCDALLDVGAASGRMDLLQGYALPVPLTIIADLLGIPADLRLRFNAWTRSIVAVSSGTSDLLRAGPSVWLFTRYLRRLFEQRRSQPREDLVSALVEAEEGGDKLSEQELLAMVMMLILAGYETTVGLIANGALALLQHPEQRNQLQEKPALAELAIEELLRYTSPLEIATPRVAQDEVTIGSVTIPRGELVLAVLGSANHDEAQFSDPETLDIVRAPNKHLAFGLGMHFCLGAPLARLEGKIALTTLLRRFPNLRLAEAPESLRWRKGLQVRCLEQLPVAVE